MSWAIRHCSWLLPWYQTWKGHTPFSCHAGHEATSELANFGETVWARKPKTHNQPEIDGKVGAYEMARQR